MKRPFHRTYRELSLATKIMMFFIPLSILPLLLVNFYVSNTYQELIIDRTLSSASDNSTLTINQIESMFESAEDCGNQLTININRLYKDLADNPSITSKVTLTNGISNEMKLSLLTYASVESLAFIDADGQLFTSSHLLEDSESEFYTSEIHQILVETTGLNTWFPLMTRDYLIKDNEVAVMTMGKKLINIYDGSTLGYLLINIPETTINNILSLQEYQYWIIDESNHVISTNSDDVVLEPMNRSVFDYPFLNKSSYLGVRKVNREKYVTTMLPFNENDWRLVGQLPYGDLTTDLQESSIYIIGIMIVFVLISVLMTWYFTSLISRPIRQLKAGMFKVSEGDFGQRLTARTNDEIGSMADSFNHMSDKIEELLITVETEQKQKRDYELALIQEQIKPHFLYNCLDVIYTLNMMGRQKDAAKATKSLADYYRVSLSKGVSIISLEDEMRNVKDYLYLQQIRYSDVFDYTIDMPATLNTTKMLKMSLQPIVENAIYHGLKENEEFGHLKVVAYEKANTVYIEISDNGCGMNDEMIEELLVPRKKRKHYGFYSVLHRIQLYFGDDYGVDIESTLGVGTTITLRVPGGR